MQWHVTHTKVREEFRTLENLQAQGFEVFYQLAKLKKNNKKKFIWTLNYCFQHTYLSADMMSPAIGFQLDQLGGASQLLRFGTSTEPIEIPETIIDYLK